MTLNGSPDEIPLSSRSAPGIGRANIGRVVGSEHRPAAITAISQPRAWESW